MYCKNCGALLADNVNFCNACGTPTANASKVGSGSNNSVLAKRRMQKQTIGLVVLIAVVVILASLISGGKGYEKAAKKFVEYMLDGNAKKCVALLSDDAVEKTGSATRKSLINTMDDALDSLRDEYKKTYGSQWKYEVEVIDSYESYSEYYNGGYLGETMEVVVEIHHSSKSLFNDKEGTETMTIILIKESGEWLVAGFGS